MAANTTGGSKKSPKKFRGIHWKDEDVKHLLTIMKEETILFSLDNAKSSKEKRAVYKRVQVQLQTKCKGVVYSIESIINKWKKLKQQYKTMVDQNRRSGTERKKKWKFFDDLDQICGHRDIISPANLFDSGGFSSEVNDEFRISPDDFETDTHIDSVELSGDESIRSTAVSKDDVEVTTGEAGNGDEVDENINRKDLGVENCPKEKYKVQKKENDIKKCSSSKKTKKTKLEKSLEILSHGFSEVAQKETETFMELERMRHSQEMEYQLKIKELDNERRREERKHELAIFQLLAKSQQPQMQQMQQPQMQQPDGMSYSTNVVYRKPCQRQSAIYCEQSPSESSTTDTSSSFNEDTRSYYQL